MKKFLAVLLLSSSAVFAQTTINATNINTKNVTALAGGGAGVDFRNANHTLPSKVGTIAALPVTCTVGERYFASDQLAGQNSYSCTALNTWTRDFSAGILVSSGTVDFSGAGHTRPAKVGLTGAIPGTCTVGEVYFATDATAGRNWYFCTTLNTWTQQIASAGTVTNVAMTVPVAIMAVSGSPITTTGTFGVTLNNQNQNLFLAGPCSGAAATPTFRVVCAGDLGSGTADSTSALGGDLTWRQFHRTLDKQDVVAGINGDSTDHTIYTYSMPSGTLLSGKCVRVTGFQHRTAGAGSATVKLFFGATTLVSSASGAATPIKQVGTVCNNAGSTTAQWAVGEYISTSPTYTTLNTTPAENTNSGSAIVIKLTFNVAAGSSFGGDGWMVEYLP